MKIENNNSVRGVGFTGLLQIAFIVLKLVGVIDWSWFYILLPAIISIAILIIFLISILGIYIYAVLKGGRE